MQKKMVLLSLLISAVSSALPQTNITALKPGDKMPDITLNIDNYSKKQVRLSELQGKLVLFDFWGTWCSSCIEGFTKMERLKKYFHDKLEIILVNSRQTRDTPEKISQAFKKRKDELQLPIVLPYINGDTILEKIFPWQYLPQLVVIDKTGRLLGITDATQLTDQDIADMIAGGKLPVSSRANLAQYDWYKPLFFGGNGQGLGADLPFIYQSFLTKEMPGLVADGGNELPDGRKRIFTFNYALKRVYTIYSGLQADLNLPATQTEWHVTSGFNREWLSDEFKICYELIGPKEVSFVTLNEYAMTDLFVRAFPFKAMQEKKRRKVFVVKQTPHLSKHASTSKQREISVHRRDIHKFLKNVEIGALIYCLSDIPASLPVIDETNLDFTIDIEFPRDIYSYTIDQVYDWLKEMGFKVTIEEREIDIVTITNLP